MSAGRPRRLSGHGRVTLVRLGGDPAGALLLAYTTTITDGHLTAVLAAIPPHLLDPGWGLETPLPGGPASTLRGGPLEWAAATTPHRGPKEAGPEYERRLAAQLVRAGHTARLARGARGTVDLPAAYWEIAPRPTPR